MGQSGLNLLPQLQQGGDGIQAFIRKAVDGGQIMSSAEAQVALKAKKTLDEAKRTIANAWDSISTTVVVALSPIVGIVGDVFKKIANFVAPVVKKIGAFWEVASPIIRNFFQFVAAQITDLIAGVGNLMNSTGVELPSTLDVVKGAFRAVAIAGAYAFDSLKIGTGALAAGIGLVLEGLAETIKLMSRIPGLESWKSAADKVDGLSDKLKEFGRSQRDSWGKSADAVRKYFETLETRQKAQSEERKKQLLDLQKIESGGYTATASIIKGSQEDLSLNNQYQFGVIESFFEKAAAAAQEKGNGLLEEIASNTKPVNNSNKPVFFGVV